MGQDDRTAGALRSLLQMTVETPRGVHTVCLRTTFGQDKETRPFGVLPPGLREHPKAPELRTAGGTAAGDAARAPGWGPRRVLAV